ncbi:MAG: ABC transporter substrate-binding protein [Bryobacterales bacterium]|nr:ABC transporter substrate-binding protein [Bryobacterales bacterium]
MGGSVEVADFIYDHTLQMAAEGQHVKTFFVMTVGSSRVLVVSPAKSGRIRRVEDLRGAVVGIPAPGSGSHLWAKYYLAKRLQGAADYSVVGVGMGSTAFAAMETGRIDAVVLSGGDHLRYLAAHPDARVLVDTSTVEGVRESFGTEFYPTGTLTAKKEWLDANPESARRLCRAVLRTVQWIGTHTAEEIRSRLPKEYQTADAAMDLKVIEWGKKKYTNEGSMPEGGPEAARRYLEATIDRVRDAKFDLAPTWTNAYLPGKK